MKRFFLPIIMSMVCFSSLSASSAKELSAAFTKVAREATPAVVFIKVQQSATPRGNGGGIDLFNDEFFQRFFGGTPSRPQQRAPQMSQGSGFIISPDGYVMTNLHVVKNASEITVSLQNGMQRELPATLIGGDPHTDIAVLKIDADDEEFPYLKFGNSDDMEVAEWVIAIGNPFQLEASVTVGVISAKGRQNLQITDLEDFIQTDAAINPGNSGGPLINLDGEVIGVNTAIATRSGGYMGIGFAVPSLIAENIKNQLVEKGSVTRGYLGAYTQGIDKDLAESFNLKNTDGALVAKVVKDSPADKAGLKQGDIITKVDGKKVKTPAGLRNKVLLKKPGSKMTFTILRNGKTQKLTITIGSHEEMGGETGQYAQELGLTVETITHEMQKKYRLDPDEEGVVITDVKPGSLAARNGLKPGFVIIAVNHEKIMNVKEFNDATKNIESGQRVLFLVKQGELMRFHSFKLG